MTDSVIQIEYKENPCISQAFLITYSSKKMHPETVCDGPHPVNSDQAISNLLLSIKNAHMVKPANALFSWVILSYFRRLPQHFHFPPVGPKTAAHARIMIYAFPDDT